MAKKVSLEDEFRRNNELKPEHFQIFKDWYAEQSDLPAISGKFYWMRLEILIFSPYSRLIKLFTLQMNYLSYFCTAVSLN